MPVGNPGSVKKGVFWEVERPLGGVGVRTPRV
jgi:hypothetical protein